MMNWIVKRAALVASPDMEKHVDLDYRRGWGPSYAPIHSKAFEKIALSTYIPDKIITAAKGLSPRQDGRYIHVNAVGAAEAYGSNRNGDEFPEWGLLHLPPPPDVEAFLREKKIAIPEEYGFETFEKYAYPFLFHNNSDPKFSVGEQVVCAGYNERMRRVELIIFILTNKAPELVAMVDKGDAIPWSMGCFIAGTPITMADGTTKPIEEIREGDLVLTHTGSIKRVSSTHVRPYEGALLDFSVEGSEPFSVTGNHPLWGIARSSAMKNGHRWLDEPKPEFLHAECLAAGDYLATPVMQEVLTPDYATIPLARLLGYYLAEGHVLRNKKGEYAGIELTVNKTDAVLSEIDDLAKAFGARNPPIVRSRTNSEHALRIDIFDPYLAELCYDHCGSYGRGKRLSEDVMQWNPDLQRHLLGAYINGDSCQAPKGAVVISTASDFLAEQIPHVLARVGIPATTQLIRHEAGGGFNESVTFEHQIYVGKQYVNTLADVARIDPVEVKAAGSGARLRSGQVFRLIEKIEERFFQGLVYNFEVEDDASYVAAGFGAHNCKVPFDVCTICKNTAKNRTEYCEHLRSLMNVILPDGRRVAAANLFPKFFDISRVTVPAFPAAYSLRKVAGAASIVADPSAIARAREYAPCDLDFHKIASVQTAMRATALAINVKQASIVKEVPAEPGQDVLPSLMSEKARKILKSFVTKDMAGSPMIPRTDLLRMQQELGLDGVLRGATASGIVLREPEVKVLSENGQPFPDSIDLDGVTPNETSRFAGMIPTRSLFDPPFAKRVVRLIKVMRFPGGGSEETSTDYDKYLRSMRGMSPAALLRAANRLEILQARDGSALDNSLVGNKTAGVQFETVLPFLIGVGVE